MDERNIETMDLEGYQIVRREQFAQEDLWIDFNPAKKDHHIFISKVCMKHLGNPPYVTMLMNPEEKNMISCRKLIDPEKAVHIIKPFAYEVNG